jgi:hypothetical protein
MKVLCFRSICRKDTVVIELFLIGIVQCSKERSYFLIVECFADQRGHFTQAVNSHPRADVLVAVGNKISESM